MASAVEFLDELVVGIVVRDEEGSSDGAAIGTSAVVEENFAVSFVVEVVDSTVKGQHDHLGHLWKGLKA